MIGRPVSAAALLSALALVLSCGSSASESTPEPVEAGCPKVVLDGGGAPDPQAIDGPSLCPSGVCNYQTQAGCSTDLACRPQFTAAAQGVAAGCEAAGTGGSEAPCAVSADCAGGYFCAANACHKQCCGADSSVCDPGERCFRELEVKAGGQVIDSGMELCFPVGNCDPLDPSPCPDQSETCAIIDATGSTACEATGMERAGNACGAGEACGAGLICVLGSCRKLCRAQACGEPACSTNEGSCVHFGRDPVGVGECTPGW